MADEQKLNLVLCWHMHQPQYRDLLAGEHLQSWTYLHAIKDYVDMAAHLERYPDVRAVVNFVPLMVAELGNYSKQLEEYLRSGGTLDDPLLDALAHGSARLSANERAQLSRMCLRANERRVMSRFTSYANLVELVRFHQDHDPGFLHLNESFFDDLVVWYHLVWLGETVRRSDIRVQRLMQKAGQFTPEDRALLLRIVSELLSGLIARYRNLSDRGQVELSMTPFAHPMLPLLMDFESAREAMPGVLLPEHAYPGGAERVRWHIEAGLRLFERAFGCRPTGCWPSEGGISDAVLPLLVEYGFEWVASGQSVLSNSLQRTGGDAHGPAWLYRAYQLHGLPLHGFFRDDQLSDAIGFNYSDWHGEDAVADLVSRIEGVAALLDQPENHVVSIIMDGENAWEHYPDNGYYFLNHLYEALSQHPKIKLTTYHDLTNDRKLATSALPSLCAGSWVYGTFSTWIGDPEKNKAWDVLVAGKRAFDEAVSDPAISAEDAARLELQLAVCEGSDWFWWFGDYNPAQSVDDFSQLFSRHINNLYTMMGRPAPAGLDVSFGRGGHAERGGAMRRGTVE